MMSKIAQEGTFVEIPCFYDECRQCEGTLKTCKLTKPEQIAEEISNYLLPVLMVVVGLIVIAIVVGVVLWYMKCLKSKAKKEAKGMQQP